MTGMPGEAERLEHLGDSSSSFLLAHPGAPQGEVHVLRHGGHAGHPCHLLSGGQKQLLALAAVLVTDPSVIVADEPTTLLDLRNRQLVAETFAALEQQLVVVTHDLDLVADFDRVLVVDGGRVVIDDYPGPALAGYRRIALER